MKKKLCITLFIITILSAILLFTKPSTPYSGKYYENSTNLELVLNPDNSFDYNITIYRNSIDIKGKYKIINNHINLFANDKSNDFYIDNISSGTVTGTVITFKQAKNETSIIFTKS